MHFTPRQVLYKEEDGVKLEPFETVDIELPEEYAGGVIDMLAQRKGQMLDMGAPSPEGMQTIQYEVPTRGMVGVKSKMLSAVRPRCHAMPKTRRERAARARAAACHAIARAACRL